MIVFRLARGKFKNDLSGRGAELAGGRWNSPGVPLLYTSENRALCTAEIAVHTPLGITPTDYFLVTIELPEKSLETIDLSLLPKGWSGFPHYPDTRVFGDRFVREEEALILKVPSAVVHGEFNYLINPQHNLFEKVKKLRVEPFKFDRRMFEK